MKTFKLILTFVIILGAVVVGFFLIPNIGPDLLSPVELTEHRNSAHFIHECDICHERFETNKELKAHKKTHNGPAPVVAKPFKCGSCSASFDKRADLEWHIKTKHDSRFQCRLCDKWFRAKIELDNHMGSMHKHYECPHCGHDTFFATREGLNAHIENKHRRDER